MAREEAGPILNGIPSQLPDIDPEETQEWLESLDGVIDESGRTRARYVMLKLLERARERQIGVPSLTATDYINTIAPEGEPWFPGDEEVERRYRAFLRWNAAVMVHRAQRPDISVGGHISTYASAATLYEVGFNHFFRGKDHEGGGDQIFIQGHGSPGIYARAFLEGRLTEQQLDGFRQEHSHVVDGKPLALPSYPHPRLMPDFWEFPTVSMGLGPMNAIYQAQFNKYLHNRGIKDTSQQHVWAFLGDGEMDEPESRGLLQVAAGEELDNLTFVINCNLQRLDGPVRGNGKIIQELEAFFRGAGWNVIKVVWGREWDPLLAADRDGALVHLMNTTPDGDYQTYRANDGAFIREHFFGRDPRTRAMVDGMTDQDIWNLKRGGHDYRKVYAAYKAAMEHNGQPTVILAKTIKGYGLGTHFAGRNATHQMKKLTLDDLKGLRDSLRIPISDEQLEANPYLPPYYHPGEDDPTIQYLRERRQKLGGGIPNRRVQPKALKLPEHTAYEAVKKGSGKQQIATTMAFVRLLKELMRDKEFGRRVVPIIPDEARTFGMDSFFPTAKIYNPHGQNYTSVDADLMLAYKESPQGQILHVGINEGGSVAAFTAAGSAYATHGEPMVPVYVFYSMFGFQRTADSIWAAADQMARGFLIGATAGRTTLTGEGLQHADGHSPLIASTNPAVVSYDPAYAYEIATIVEDGLRRMYGD
ncbi:MAG TPA: pyruvate dehydrogenase (acetyl-transferring), homodimeric type, partial [Oryzihumus sp.]